MKKGPHKMMLESSRVDKFNREHGTATRWVGRDRNRQRVLEQKARAAHQVPIHGGEIEPPPLFSAPVKVTGDKDLVSQQIQTKLGDFQLAQAFMDDPSKSIGVCAEPSPSPAQCPPSRRESEFKKPAHAPQNGRVQHHSRYHPYPPKVDPHVPTSASTHRTPHKQPPISNGYSNNSIESTPPPIESILKEMKTLPTLVSVIAATPRKEADNKFVFNHYTNKVQENPSVNSDLKAPVPRPGLDNRISNSRSSVSPDVVNKDLGLSESDDQLEPILSPIGSAPSPSSASESSPSDSESESSSAESSGGAAPTPAPVPAPAQRSSWSLSNFAPPPAQPPEQTYDSDKRIIDDLVSDIKGKPFDTVVQSPISDLTDSDASAPSPGATRRRRSVKRNSVASSDEETSRPLNTTSPRVSASAPANAPLKRGRPPKSRTSEERPAKKKRGRPPKQRPASPLPSAAASAPAAATPAPAPPAAVAPPAAPADSDAEPDPPQHHSLQDTKTHIFRKVFTPKKGDECGGKGGKGGKGKGGKGKGQVTIIDVTAPESGADDDDRRHRERSVERRLESEHAPAHQPGHQLQHQHQFPHPLFANPHHLEHEGDALARRLAAERLNERVDHRRADERIPDRASADRTSNDRTPSERVPNDRIPSERTSASDRVSAGGRTSMERPPGGPPSERHERYVRAEADVGSALKSGRNSERLEEASSNVIATSGRERVMVKLSLARLRPEFVRALRAQRARRGANPPRRLAAPADTHPDGAPDTHATQHADTHADQGAEVAATNHERTGACADQTPIFYSYFERLPPDTLSDEERDHKYYLGEAKRLRTAAEREQEPLPRVMLYLESVLCFVLTGRVLELEFDTKRAFTIYRETIEYIKSIHSMPQRYRASPHSTFSKLDILSLRVQALLYLRMFKMYNREVKEYYKIVQDYQQKPACAESVSPLSPTPSPAGSVGSVGSAASASSGYCSLAHSVPAHTHHALLQLTKYYTFLYVAHDLWEQADCLCRLRPNQDLFIAVDRRCGPLTLFSTFRHLVQYVRYAISLLKDAPRE